MVPAAMADIRRAKDRVLNCIVFEIPAILSPLRSLISSLTTYFIHGTQMMREERSIAAQLAGRNIKSVPDRSCLITIPFIPGESHMKSEKAKKTLAIFELGLYKLA
jgi:hypothetical protein